GSTHHRNTTLRHCHSAQQGHYRLLLHYYQAQHVICEVNQVMMEQSSTLREDEEEFLRRMLEEEEQRDTVYYHQYQQEKMRNDATSSLASSMQKMGVNETVAAKSTLNPYAAEFIPGKNFTRPAETPTLVHHTNGDKKSS
ncbi:hypothetical protein OTU49_008769, partial [Cherax quadricarinatus]